MDTKAEPACDQCPPSILKKIYYLDIYPLRLSIFCKTLTLLTVHLGLSGLDLHYCSFFFLLSSSSYGSSSLTIIFLLLICGTKLFFIFNYLPTTHQLFTLLQPRGSPSPTLFTFYICILLF